MFEIVCIQQSISAKNIFSKLPLNLSIYFSRFRCMNHRLPVEFGRFSRLESAKRKCKLCKSGDLEDEFHYLFNCSHFKSECKQTISLQYRKKLNIMETALCENDPFKSPLI